MSSHITLALAAASPAPTFNRDFYTTAATVIPALFIALAVLGPTYRNALRSAWHGCKFWFTHPLPGYTPPRPRSAPRWS